MHDYNIDGTVTHVTLVIKYAVVVLVVTYAASI